MWARAVCRRRRSWRAGQLYRWLAEAGHERVPGELGIDLAVRPSRVGVPVDGSGRGARSCWGSAELHDAPPHCARDLGVAGTEPETSGDTDAELEIHQERIGPQGICQGEVEELDAVCPELTLISLAVERVGLDHRGTPAIFSAPQEARQSRRVARPPAPHSGREPRDSVEQHCGVPMYLELLAGELLERIAELQVLGMTGYVLIGREPFHGDSTPLVRWPEGRPMVLREPVRGSGELCFVGGRAQGPAPVQTGHYVLRDRLLKSSTQIPDGMTLKGRCH